MPKERMRRRGWTEFGLIAIMLKKGPLLRRCDGREEMGLAEGVGPGVGDLRFELVDGVVEGDLFEGGGGFGEEDEVEVIVGPVGE